MSTEKLDGRWEGPNGQILVELKKTNSVRDVRDALLALTYLIKNEPLQNQAVCVISGTKLSFFRLQDELKQFLQVIHPEIAQRIHFLIDQGEPLVGSNRFIGSLHEAPIDFFGWLEHIVEKESHHVNSHKLPARQTVRVALAELRLHNAPPVTLKYLQEVCDVSYPTVAETLKQFAATGLLLDDGDRGVSLRHLTMAEWMDLARDHAKVRKSFSFVDPTGFTTTDQLRNRLLNLKDAGRVPQTVHIGGVTGATKIFPALDITAAFRLDLSVESDPMAIATLLDAGLKPKGRPDQTAILVIHVTTAPKLGFDAQTPWANTLECLADLIEMGYVREATEMAQHVEFENRQGSSRQ